MAEHLAELARRRRAVRSRPSARSGSPVRQRFTFRQTVSTMERADSITLAQHRVRRSWTLALSRCFGDLARARVDGSLRSLLARLSRIDVLVIDDCAMAPLSEPERRDFWKICEESVTSRPCPR